MPETRRGRTVVVAVVAAAVVVVGIVAGIVVGIVVRIVVAARLPETIIPWCALPRSGGRRIYFT